MNELGTTSSSVENHDLYQLLHTAVCRNTLLVRLDYISAVHYTLQYTAWVCLIVRYRKNHIDSGCRFFFSWPIGDTLLKARMHAAAPPVCLCRNILLSGEHINDHTNQSYKNATKKTGTYLPTYLPGVACIIVHHPATGLQNISDLQNTISR